MICPRCNDRVVAGDPHTCGGTPERGGLGRSSLPPAYGTATREALTRHFLVCSPLSPFWIRQGKPIVIGRARTCDLSLSGTLVSREHARVELRGDKLFAYDLASRNGTNVNGTRIEEAELAPGDIMTIGGWAFTYQTAFGASAFLAFGDATSVREVETARLTAASLRQALQIRQRGRELDAESENESQDESHDEEPIRRHADGDDEVLDGEAAAETLQGDTQAPPVKIVPDPRPPRRNGRDSDISAILLGRAD